MAWKKHPNYPNYEISTSGKVRRIDKKRLVAQLPDRDGYLHVVLWSNGKRKNFRMNRLVAELYCPNFDPLAEVHHKDNNRTNNRKENLECCQRPEHLAMQRGEEYDEIMLYDVKTNELLYRSYSLEHAARLADTLPGIVIEALQGDGTNWACDGFRFERLEF